MIRRLAAERRAGELAAAIGNDLVHIHVELGTAARHPDVQREHVMVPAGENLVARLGNETVDLIVEPLARVIRVGCAFLQDGVCRDHLARNQIGAYAEMLQRPLRLRSPELVGRYFDLAETVGFGAYIAHCISPELLRHVIFAGCYFNCVMIASARTARDGSRSSLTGDSSVESCSASYRPSCETAARNALGRKNRRHRRWPKGADRFASVIVLLA